MKFVQLILEGLGYLSDQDVDCEFGGKTKEALIELQTDSNLTRSGTVDPDTLALLENLYDSPNTSDLA